MATKKQKEELIAVLKFTPVTYKVYVHGYGGETYAGRVDRKIYEYFKRNDIDIDDFASDWDNESEVPPEYQPFEPGSPYECDDLGHASGATMDESSHIVVHDENGNEVWRCTLNAGHLDDEGVEVDGNEEMYFGNLDPGTIVLWGGQGEKGTFFGGDIELKMPFDPKKLTVTYSDCDGWDLLTGVSYDGEDIDNGDYSTTGKWGEHKWLVIGGEENLPEYKLEEEDLVADLDHIVKSVDIMTDWYPKDIKPVRKGEYEVCVDAAWPNGGIIRAEWTGRTWKQSGKTVKITQWRGLANDPAKIFECTCTQCDWRGSASECNDWDGQVCCPQCGEPVEFTE